MKVIHFSGGKSSALMTILCYAPGDLVLFCDTGREHYKTYKFIHDFEAFEQIPVIKLQYPGGFEELERIQKGIPNQFKRFCTRELKKNTARRFLRSQNIIRYTQLIGFRHDEQQRVKNYKQQWQQVKTIFPLSDYRITKRATNYFWSKQPYNLEIPPILSNCTLCFNKGKNAIIRILTSYPELAEKWILDEKRDPKQRTFLKGISMEKMLLLSQHNLFPVSPLEDFDPAFSCACEA